MVQAYAPLYVSIDLKRYLFVWRSDSFVISLLFWNKTWLDVVHKSPFQRYIQPFIQSRSLFCCCCCCLIRHISWMMSDADGMLNIYLHLPQAIPVPTHTKQLTPYYAANKCDFKYNANDSVRCMRSFNKQQQQQQQQQMPVISLSDPLKVSQY